MESKAGIVTDAAQSTDMRVIGSDDLRHHNLEVASIGDHREALFPPAARSHDYLMQSDVPNQPSARRPLWPDILIALVPVFLASVLGSAATVPQIPGWYAGLAKPPFNPPNWIFAPVWTILFAMMAYAVFRILRQPFEKRGVLVAYHVQLVLNLAWSCVFFGLNSPLGGLLIILPLLVLILVTIAVFGRLDRLAGLLLWPYAAWVSFATLLNLSIWWLNR